MILETRRSYRAATACGPDASRSVIRFSALWIASSEISKDRAPFIAKPGDMLQQIGPDPAYLRPVETEALPQVGRPVGTVQQEHSFAFRPYNMHMSRRVIIHLDRDTQPTDAQDRRHRAHIACSWPIWNSMTLSPTNLTSKLRTRYHRVAAAPRSIPVAGVNRV